MRPNYTIAINDAGELVIKLEKTGLRPEYADLLRLRLDDSYIPTDIQQTIDSTNRAALEQEILELSEKLPPTRRDLDLDIEEYYRADLFNPDNCNIDKKNQVSINKINQHFLEKLLKLLQNEKVDIPSIAAEVDQFKSFSTITLTPLIDVLEQLKKEQPHYSDCISLINEPLKKEGTRPIIDALTAAIKQLVDDMESPSANSNFSHFSKIVTNAKKATDRLLRRATSEIPERISTILHDCGFTSSQTTRASTSLFTIANDDDTQDRRPAAGAASGIG